MSRASVILHRTRSFLRRNATTIPLAIIALCIGGVFAMQAVVIGQLSDQVRYQNQLLEETKQLALKIEDNAQDRSEQVKQLERHMDCIVKFFAQKDRSRKAIKEIESCRIGKVASPATRTAEPRPSTKPKPSQPDPVVRQEVALPERQAERSGSKPSSTKPPVVQPDKSTEEEPTRKPSVVDWLLDLIGLKGGSL